MSEDSIDNSDAIADRLLIFLAPMLGEGYSVEEMASGIRSVVQILSPHIEKDRADFAQSLRDVAADMDNETPYELDIKHLLRSASIRAGARNDPMFREGD